MALLVPTSFLLVAARRVEWREKPSRDQSKLAHPGTLNGMSLASVQRSAQVHQREAQDSIPRVDSRVDSQDALEDWRRWGDGGRGARKIPL